MHCTAVPGAALERSLLQAVPTPSRPQRFVGKDSRLSSACLIQVGLSGRKVPWTTWTAAAVALTGTALHSLGAWHCGILGLLGESWVAWGRDSASSGSPSSVSEQAHRPEACALDDAGVGLLTTSGVEPNIGDALCIGSATLFGVHKWRSETVTARFRDSTNELIAVQLLALAGAAAAFSAPQVFHLAEQGPGGRH